MALSGSVTEVTGNSPSNDIRWDIIGFPPSSGYIAYMVTTSDGKSTTWSDGTTFDFTLEHAYGATITGDGWAQHRDTPEWLPVGSASVTMPGSGGGGDPDPPSDTTAPTVTSFFIMSINPTSITVSASGSDSGGSGFNSLNFYISPGSPTPPSPPYQGPAYAYTSSSATHTFTGLTPGYYYTVDVMAMDNAFNTSHSSIWDVQTSIPRPQDWEWYFPKASGDAFNIPAYEWNDFTDRINAFVEYQFQSPYSFSAAISGDLFYAFQFNEAADVISFMSPPLFPPSPVLSGDVVFALDINLLRDSLNSIP